jgi:hypothetical protein
MYLVTYEMITGLGCMEYGIMSVHNKPQSAQSALKKLIKEQQKKDGVFKKHKFDLKTVDINSPLTTKLFYYAY